MNSSLSGITEQADCTGRPLTSRLDRTAACCWTVPVSVRVGVPMVGEAREIRGGRLRTSMNRARTILGLICERRRLMVPSPSERLLPWMGMYVSAKKGAPSSRAGANRFTRLPSAGAGAGRTMTSSISQSISGRSPVSSASVSQPCQRATGRSWTLRWSSRSKLGVREIGPARLPVGRQQEDPPALAERFRRQVALQPQHLDGRATLQERVESPAPARAGRRSAREDPSVPAGRSAWE